MLKTLFKKLLPSKFYLLITQALACLDLFSATKTWSQQGEDLALARIFRNKKAGFYIDIGAHHPKKYSNTFYFYKRGWRGINVDALPNSMMLFNLIRRKDINLEAAVSSKTSTLMYYMFDLPALNGFDKELSESRAKLKHGKLLNTKMITTTTLEEVLDEHLPPGTHIDFISIDVEGLDLEILQSNNWSKYKPHAIVVEQLTDENVIQNTKNIKSYLRDKGYSLKETAGKSAIYTLAAAE